jgi:hypothetical protein
MHGQLLRQLFRNPAPKERMRTMRMAAHKHEYREVAVYYPASLGAAFCGIPQTVVLLRCGCRNLDTVTLPGKWTLAQVRGKADLDEHEKAELDLAAASSQLR